ncbi:acyl-CoA dehydrogenase family protein [Gordonia sp. NPDC003585]|uniref:acyl-CoA dehydrogenase family protein n=1 Tax=Gordonia sp. NPDC003585 TaxID=3154275 RepID=UPI0033B9BCE9
MHDISTDEVRTSLRTYFADHPGIAEVRHNRDATDQTGRTAAGFDVAGWRTLSEQVGITGLGTPESWGGLQLPAAHLVAAAEECGATLYPGPVRATLLLSAALVGVDPDAVPTQEREVVESILAGSAVVGTPTGDNTLTYADGRVSGRLGAVTHGAVAHVIVASVSTPQGPALALIHTGDARIERTSVPGVDLVVPLADIAFSDTPALLLTTPADAGVLARHHRLETMLLAAEQVGGAQGCLTGMVEYAKVREQFGQVIGTYQAISHRCAHTAVATAAARALVVAAADAHDADNASAAEQIVLLARAQAADTYSDASSALIQVSGGIGFTWEHDAHLYFRHARATAAIGGTPDQFRDRAVTAGCLDLLTPGAA